MDLKWTAIWWGSLCFTMKNCILYIIDAEKKPVFWHPYCICICALRCITFYFCSEIYYGCTQIQYKIYSNTIVNNLSTMRKRQETQFSNKVAIWVSNEQQFDGDNYAWKKNCFFDTHIVSIFVHCVALRIIFVQKFILLGPKYSTKSTATQ